MSFPLCPGQSESLVFVFLCDSIINLMYNIIKKLYFTSTCSEFKNDFDKTR